MKCPGGYLIMDFTGTTINSDSAVTIVDSAKSEILRTANKPVYMCGLTHGAMSLDVVADMRTNTGAIDGKVYGFVGPNGKFFNVTTDDSSITFTPV